MNDAAPGMTVGSLIAKYQSDPRSPYRKLTPTTRDAYDRLLRRIDRDLGAVLLTQIKSGALIDQHRQWSGGGARRSMAYALIQMLRRLTSFGIVHLDNDDSRSFRSLLQSMRFKGGRNTRDQHLTRDQIDASRSVAHEMGRSSLALALALQHDCEMLQRDVIGEWEPVANSDPTGLVDPVTNKRWFRGILCSSIDDNMILRHAINGQPSVAEFDLNKCPMVIEELKRLPGGDRDGPLVINEGTGLPYTGPQFRIAWREVAEAAGIPKNLRSTDVRPRKPDRLTERNAKDQLRILISGLESIRDFRRCDTADAMSALAAQTLIAAASASARVARPDKVSELIRSKVDV